MKQHRKIVLIASVAAVLLIAVGMNHYYDADRQLDRGWTGFMEAIESRSMSGVHRLLAPDYTDCWGYDKASLGKDLWRIFYPFESIKLTPREVLVAREGDTATIGAKVTMASTGSGLGADAQNQVNRLTKPFVIKWRRDSGFPWSWKITRIDQPEFDAKRYQRHRSAGPLGF
ncbi:MAG: hypothetical protein LBD14_05585 [Puniceicoccales bacterium]|jgi:hypothetical protein|nr:hypothetical protein [Puniceicoccales bacterium]